METYDRRVLLVDDDDAVRTVCSINLGLAGLSVLEAADGMRAFELARAELPDLVITDVTMPLLDGFGLAAALRADERTSGIPFMFLSGETALAARVRADALGALAYLTKPFDPHAVATFVADTLLGTTTHERSGAMQPAA